MLFFLPSLARRVVRLTSIETTPNPNSMKLNVDEPVGPAVTYSQANRSECPTSLAPLLDLQGVQSIFACQNFITVNRDPRADWKPILDSAVQLLGGAAAAGQSIEEQRQEGEKLGQVTVVVQTFRGIPIQVKAMDAHGEKRIALETRFSEAAQLIQAQSKADYLKERHWADWGVRYGTVEEAAAEVADEIQGTLDQSKIQQLIDRALGKEVETQSARCVDAIKSGLESADWHRRLQAVQELGITEDAVPLLIGSLKDPSPQVRRLAAAALGASGSEAAIGPLSDTLLNDASVAVRRTAGDALSDLGDIAAQPAACRALEDANKLVRWRAARFLAEVGNEEALPFLKDAVADPEFEVRLEVEAAMERISKGKAGSMPVWKRISEGSGDPQ